MLRILTLSIINVGYHLSSRNLRNCASYTRELWNDINLVSEWSRQPKIIDKFAFGVLPERVDTLSTLFAIDINIFHGFTFTTYLLNTYEIWTMLKRHITLFMVLCALRIK